MRLKLCYLVAGWPGIAVPSGSAQLPTHTRRSSSSPSYHWRTISINTFKRSALFLQQTQHPEIPGGLSRGHYSALWCQITFSKGLHVNRYIQRCGLALQYRQDRPTSPLTPEDHHQPQHQPIIVIDGEHRLSNKSNPFTPTTSPKPS